jgi:hypothetical protein
VIGSYVVAEEVRVKRPRRAGRLAAHRPAEPTVAAAVRGE